MAVQAHYPSNVLNNPQQGHDQYSFPQQQQQPQPHQSNIIFFNTTQDTTNSRKRGRETEVMQMNPFSLQSYSPNLIDLTQLHNHQQQHQHHQQHQNIVSTGLGLSFGDHQQQQQRLQLQQQQQQQQNGFNSSHFLSLLSQGLASQMKQQKDEIDQFLQTQGEELKRTLEEKRQRNYRAIIKTAEETVARGIREKEIKLEKATRKNAELESRAAQLKAESNLWEAKAKAQEATAISLQTQLHNAIMNGGAEKMAEEGCMLSCAVGGENQAEDAESGYIDPGRVLNSGPKCRGCGKRVASIVVLPCRHLCVCSECDVHFRVCPVCFTVKNSTVEIFLS